MNLTLSSLRKGQKALVCSIRNGSCNHLLHKLGICEGCTVEVLSHNRTMRIRCEECVIAVNKSMLDDVVVEQCVDPINCSHKQKKSRFSFFHRFGRNNCKSCQN